MVKVRAFRTLENTIRRLGFNLVAGVDEVGRGCLAGPVIAAAVILDPDRYIPRICDSKTVTALERAKLYDKITRAAVAWGVAGADPPEIDAINIHQASLRAMQRADPAARPASRTSSSSTPSACPTCRWRSAPYPRRRACTAIAAASIVAKVTRDRMMLELHAHGSAVRLRSPQGLRHARSPGRGLAVRLLRRPPALVPASVPV